MRSSGLHEAAIGDVPMILDASVFKQTIVRERKRAERSGLAMILVSVALPDTVREVLPSRGVALANALATVKSDIDILGWIKQSSIIGLILPEVPVASLSLVCDRLKTQIHNVTANDLDGDLGESLSLTLRVYPEPWKREVEQQHMDPVFFPELNTKNEGFTDFHRLKRGLDILLSVLLLITLSPIFLAIAGLVKLSSRGPVIFRQVRIGQMMKPFMMCKFRTMYENSDHGIHHHYVSWFITSSDNRGEQGTQQFFKLTNDGRITSVGHFLRRTSLDELPQLWNVLVGEMSLVGPRPPLRYELEQYKPWHRTRVLEAKPGITGLWQVVGRSRTTFDEMVRLDLRYARTRSLWGDLKILLATPAAIITGKGAC